MAKRPLRLCTDCGKHVPVSLWDHRLMPHTCRNITLQKTIEQEYLEEARHRGICPACKRRARLDFDTGLTLPHLFVMTGPVTPFYVWAKATCEEGGVPPLQLLPALELIAAFGDSA